jgi:CRP/FNR family transcriptional regulator
MATQLKQLISSEAGQNRRYDRGSVVDFRKPVNKCIECNARPACPASAADDVELKEFNAISGHPAPKQKGQFFYRQGDPFTSLYRVRSGAVKNYHIDKNGQEHITAFFLPGELFGSEGMANGQHQNFAQALDTSSVCEIKYDQLWALLQTSSSVHEKLIKALMSECVNKVAPLLFLHHRPVEERLITFIADVSSRYQARGLSSKTFRLPMSRRDIAHYLGTREETISRLFSSIKRLGLISVNKRSVTINDLDRLNEMSLHV